MRDLLHDITWTAPEDASAGEQATRFALPAQEAMARFVLDDDETQRYLDDHAQYA
jgi:hypothetical protein